MKKRFTALLIAFIFCLSSVQIFAEDAMEPSSETVLNDRAQEESTEEIALDTTDGDMESDGSTDALVPQEDKPNSWRYEDGQLIEGTEEGTNAGIGAKTYDLAGSAPYHSEATYTGIDVSSWQKTIDWNKVKAAGIDFAIIRCGYGNNQEDQDDSQFLRNVTECERLGIPYGVYIYSYATNTTMAASEADHVLRLINGRNLSMPVYFDMEDKSTIGSNYAAIAKTFCDKIKNAGYPVGVYANTSWWNNYLTDPCFDNWYKWVAQYYTECQYKGKYAMWQYTSSGRVNGISTNVDMNYLIGYPDNHGFHTISDSPIEMNTYNINNALGSKTSDRAYGANRYDTAYGAANLLLKTYGMDRFNSIVVACGTDYPDALAGSYLAKMKSAPILLIDRYGESKVRSYISSHLVTGGTVYILGGTGVVSSSFEKSLINIGISTQRLGGADRYATNLAILDAAGIPTGESKDILICTGLGYADSLSASAVGKPIMLVGNSLTAKQREYLNRIKPDHIYLIGGMGVVNRQIAAQCGSYSKSVIRIAGDDRYATSINVAKSFFSKSNQSAVLVYGLDFPDGLSGSSVATAMGAPIILTSNVSYGHAVAYGNERNVNKGIVLGGPTLISDAVKNKIIN